MAEKGRMRYRKYVGYKIHSNTPGLTEVQSVYKEVEVTDDVITDTLEVSNKTPTCEDIEEKSNLRNETPLDKFEIHQI